MKNNNLEPLHQSVKEHSNEYLAKFLQRFFKTGKGEYAQGDVFAGIKVPVSRKIAKQFYHLSLKDISILIKSKIHEERLIALIILTHKMKKADEQEKEKIINLYLKSIKYINNWDLVDLSADKILGEYLLVKKEIFYLKLVKVVSGKRELQLLLRLILLRRMNFLQH